MKKILVPTDFSAESTLGLRMAITFANQMKANVRLVHVKEYGSVEEAEEKLTALVDEYQEKLNEGIIDFKIREGKVYREVVNQAKYDDAAMIVSSTHGASGFEEFFVGSNAYRIVSAANCPVLTIRKGACPYTKISKIVVPIDKTNETRQKIPFACEIARLFGAHIHLIGVADDDIEGVKKALYPYMCQVEKYFKERDIDYTMEYLSGGNNAEVVIDYAKSIKAQLIVSMTEQERTFSNILLGPYAEQMVNHSSIPLLFVHPKDHYIHSSFSTFGDMPVSS